MSTTAYDSVANMRTSLESGNGVIKRLLHVYNVMVKGPKPESFGKHTEKGVSKLVSHFGPGVATEKGSAIEDLVAKAKTERPLLERLNNDLLKAAEWCKEVTKIMTDLSPSLVKMRPDLHASTTFDYMSLVAMFCRICFIATKIPGPDRRALVAIPARIVGSTDEKFTLLSDWVVKIDAPISFIQESLAPAAAVIGQLMKCEASLGSIMTEALNSEKLRNDGVINLIVKPNEMTTSSDDYLRYELAISPFVRDWIYFGFIACPQIAAEDGEAAYKSSLKPILDDNFVVHLGGGLTIPLHETLENAWANVKIKESKAKKAFNSQKKHFHEAFGTATTKSFSRRKDRRLFLTQELRSLYQVAKDSPGIVAPKFHMFLAALSLAKEEIMWYLRHVTDGPTYFPKKSEKDDWSDPRVVELIFYQLKLEELVFQQNEDVAGYYGDFFASVACGEMSKMTGMIAALNDPEATTSANEMATLFNKLAANPEGIPDDLDTLDEIYEKCCVIDFAAARRGAQESLAAQGGLVRARVFGNAAFLVESLDLVLDKYSSIMGTWYFNDELYAVFKAHAQGETKAIGAPYAAAYLRLLEEFGRNPAPEWPEERPLIGEACIKWADKYCKAVTSAASKDIVQMVQYAQTFVANMSEMNALQFLEKSTATKEKNKDQETVVRPGYESDLGARERVLRLRFANRNLRQLLSAFNSVTPITIYDTEIAPLSYLHDMLEELLTRFIRGAFDPRQSKDGELRRPTDIRKRLDAIYNTFSSLEHACPLGIEQMWQKIFLSEFYDGDLCKFGTTDTTPIKEATPKPVEDYVFMPNPADSDKLPRAWDVTLSWYRNFVSNIMTSAADGKIIFSSALREFVTRQNLSPKEAEVIPVAENMTSFAELKALASIVGPYGIRIFDAILLKRISEEVAVMLKVVDTHKETLREINSNYTDDTKFFDLVRKVKNIDAFVRAGVQVGVAIQLRQIVKSALFAELEAQTPHLACILTNAFNSYPRNIRPDDKLLALDIMASDHGVSVGEADQSLKQAVKAAATASGTNIDAWKNMPVMFGIMFLCAPWRDTHYIVSHRAYNNNLHLLAPVVNEVIIALSSMSAAGAAQADTDVQDNFSLFVDIASLTLLRQQRVSVKSSTKSPDWAAIMFFPDIFLDECRLIPRDVLEQCLPYTLLRNIITELNRRPAEPGWQA